MHSFFTTWVDTIITRAQTNPMSAQKSFFECFNMSNTCVVWPTNRYYPYHKRDVNLFSKKKITHGHAETCTIFNNTWLTTIVWCFVLWYVCTISYGYVHNQSTTRGDIRMIWFYFIFANISSSPFQLITCWHIWSVWRIWRGQLWTYIYILLIILIIIRGFSLSLDWHIS